MHWMVQVIPIRYIVSEIISSAMALCFYYSIIYRSADLVKQAREPCVIPLYGFFKNEFRWYSFTTALPFSTLQSLHIIIYARVHSHLISTPSYTDHNSAKLEEQKSWMFSLACLKIHFVTFLHGLYSSHLVIFRIGIIPHFVEIIPTR